MQQDHQRREQPRHQADETVVMGKLTKAGAMLLADPIMVEHLEPGFPRWNGRSGPKAAETLAKQRIPSFTRRVRQDSAIRSSVDARSWPNTISSGESGLSLRDQIAYQFDAFGHQFGRE